jgi:acetoin utilization protein AcuB
MKTVHIKDIMVREIVTISPDLDLCKAVKMMVDRKIGCLPVVDHDRLVGLITETDIMLQYLKNCVSE